jgi:hypothetical protein
LRAERLSHSSTIKLNDYARFVQRNRKGQWVNCRKTRGVNSYNIVDSSKYGIVSGDTVVGPRAGRAV